MQSQFAMAFAGVAVGQSAANLQHVNLHGVKDEGINSGVFDSKLSEAFVATIPVDYDSREINASKGLARWQSR